MIVTRVFTSLRTTYYFSSSILLPFLSSSAYGMGKKEPISLSQIEVCKIYGKLNCADLHTMPLRCPAYAQIMADKILGQPPRTPIQFLLTTTTPTDILATIAPANFAMDAHDKPSSSTSRRSTATSAKAQKVSCDDAVCHFPISVLTKFGPGLA